MSDPRIFVSYRGQTVSSQGARSASARLETAGIGIPGVDLRNNVRVRVFRSFSEEARAERGV